MSVQMTTPGLEAAPWVPGSLTVLEPRLTFVASNMHA